MNISEVKKSEEAIVLLLSFGKETRQRLKPVIKSGVWTVIEVLEKVRELGECDSETLAKEVNKSDQWTRGVMGILCRMPIGLTYKLQTGKVGNPKHIYFFNR